MLWKHVVGLHTAPLFQHEKEVFDAIENGKDEDFDERQQEIIRQLTVRGLVKSKNGKPVRNVNKGLRRI